MSSSSSPNRSEASDDDEDVTKSRSQPTSSAQKESIEEKRRRAQELRASKRPLSHAPAMNVTVAPAKVSKLAGPTRVIDNGGGFLIEEDAACGSSTAKVQIVHEPGAILEDVGCVCDDCDKPFLESYLMTKFDKSVCDMCKETNEKLSYKLITKTDAKIKYQLKDVDLDKREPPLKYIVKKNPRHDKWGEMKLYLESQVAERAVEVHGSKDQIEKEKQKKLERRELAQQKKFDKNVQALRLSMIAKQPTKLHVGHKHEFGPDVYNAATDEYTKKCKECGHAVTFEKM